MLRSCGLCSPSDRSVGLPPQTLPLYSEVPMAETALSQIETDALRNYRLDHAYDEMFQTQDTLHPHYEPLLRLAQRRAATA